MLANVKQAMIAAHEVKSTITPGSLIFTDEYKIYARLITWGYQHKSVSHARGEYARDEDGDGFHEVHVNTIEGFWSLLRSWLRPHRGISQEKRNSVSGQLHRLFTMLESEARPCSQLYWNAFSSRSLESILSVLSYQRLSGGISINSPATSS